MAEPTIATPLQTKEALLQKSQRRDRQVPIRTAFVQLGEQRRPSPGILAALVQRHDELALDLYLLAHALATRQPYQANQPALVWARAVGLPAHKVGRVSKAWARLEEHKLIRRGRRQRLSSITLLREDASGTPYGHPGEVGERYFKLPFDYWLDGWDANLNLPAKAMLLVALSLRAGFVLPSRQAKAWYGLSADTLERGLRELERGKLLRRVKRFKVAPLTPQGYTEQWHYELRPPFRSRPARTSDFEDDPESALKEVRADGVAPS